MIKKNQRNMQNFNRFWKRHLPKYNEVTQVSIFKIFGSFSQKKKH